MPYKSQAQRRKFHAMAARGEIDPRIVREHDVATRGMMLPERVKPVKKKAFREISDRAFDRLTDKQKDAYAKKIEAKHAAQWARSGRSHPRKVSYDVTSAPRKSKRSKDILLVNNVLRYLSYGGSAPSSQREIREYFGISSEKYKKVIGSLKRQRKVKVNASGNVSYLRPLKKTKTKRSR